jgi:enterochelin esterase-like enzyme
MKRLVSLCLLAIVAPAFAQQQLISPEVHRGGPVTFRLRAPNAKQVTLRLEKSVVMIQVKKDPSAEPEVRAMQKDDQGVWSVRTELLQPDIYVYSFNVDGVQMIDPSNPLIKRNLFNSESLLNIPWAGNLWDVADVPHGVLHRHLYHSAIIADDRPFIVYTPPEYDPAAKEPYPVLYLLHGFSDTEDAWTGIGQANVILDNLIRRGEAKPMVIVMPLGYGNKQIMTGGWGVVSQRNVWQDSIEKFRDALLKEVMLQVEKAYRVSTDRNERAIAGLSMGGTQSLFIGLNAADRFTWIGAFSSGGMDPNFEKSFPAVNESTISQLRLLWIGCGQHDSLVKINRDLATWFQSKKLNPTWVEIPGGHSFMVWRRFLGQFASLLFQSPPDIDSKGVRYFPPETLGGSRFLKIMGEPSISDANGTREFAYRFLWRRTFHHPISVRIQKSGPSTVLRAVELDGAAGYYPGRVLKEVNKELSQPELEAALARLNKTGFWQMPIKDDSRWGLDGATWILEGNQGGKYHVVTRWSPESGDFRELCRYLVQLSGLAVPEKEIY